MKVKQEQRPLKTALDIRIETAELFLDYHYEIKNILMALNASDKYLEKLDHEFFTCERSIMSKLHENISLLVNQEFLTEDANG